VVARRSLPCYASKLPTSLPSRPNHNAASPPVVDLCIRAQRLREPTGGHHVIVGPRGAASVRSSPPARKGRSEAEWLDGAEDRRTIRARDGRSEQRRAVQREDLRDERDAQVGRLEGDDGQVTVSGVDSVRVRVHQYERRFRRIPDRSVDANVNGAGTTRDSGGSSHDDTHRARFYRTTVTCTWA